MFAGGQREAEERVRHFQILLAREAMPPPTPAAGAAASRPAEAVPVALVTAGPGQGILEQAAGGHQKGTEEVGEGHQRGRPRRRAGYESWVTAEQRDEAEAEAQQRRQQQQPEHHHQPPPRRPRTASRESGPGRCRWTTGGRAQPPAAAAAAGAPAGGRQRSVGSRPAREDAWEEVEREFRRQQRAGEDLEGRVRDNLQVEQQERMQQLQEAERRETARTRVLMAAREVEARLAGVGQGRLAHGPQGADGTGEMGIQLVPTFGPTGQRLDEQQHLLRAAAVGGGAAEGLEAAMRRPSVPRRRPRWGDESEAEEEGGRERSQRGARGARLGRGAMED